LNGFTLISKICVNPSNLCHLCSQSEALPKYPRYHFNAHTGYNFFEFINRIRIAEAKNLMRDAALNNRLTNMEVIASQFQ
jgi:AraC-like DNA-binding protein